MANSNVDSKAYHEQINKMAKNLSALNAVYELELQDSSNHLKSMNKFYANTWVQPLKTLTSRQVIRRCLRKKLDRLAKNFVDTKFNLR